MKRKFTKLLAALGLLVFMMPSLVAWGQRSTEVSSLVFTAKCNGSGTADDGVEWTVTSDGTESNFDETKGIHYGTNSAAVKYINLTTNQISGTITKVVVNASTASGVTAAVDVKIGGSAFGGDPQSTSTTATNYTFTGSASGEIIVTHTKPESATKAIYVKSIVVTYTAGQTYTITPQSNNTTYGTVALSGYTITATPFSGYRVVAGNGGYTVTAGEATVVNNGDNTFTVTPSSDCTVQINFEAIPTHTAYFSVNGAITSQTFAEGAAIVFPADPADIDGKAFVGWTETSIAGTTNTPPTFVTSATMSNSDVTFYAVFADVDENGDTYEKLSSNSFDTNAKYVIGATQASNNNTMWYFYNYTAVDENISWGEMTTSPETVTPVKFTLSGTSSALVAQDDDGNYLEGLTTARFKMSSTQKSVAITESGTIKNSGNGTYYLRHNYNSGNGGLRWYSSSTGTNAYFYKVIPVATYSNYCTTVVAATVATPTFNPAAGNYNSIQNVTISCATANSTIYYTTDGTDPDSHSTEYTAAINVAVNMTIKAIAYVGTESSAVATASYTIILPQVATPTFNPASGDYYTTQSVELTCETSGAAIYYTTDNSTPTTSSTLYSSAIAVSSSTTIKAIAIKDGMQNSEIATATYNILPAVFNQEWEGSMNGWSFVSVSGDQAWSIGNYSNNKFAKMSGFANSSNHANEDWCISPSFNLDDYTNPVLTFETARSSHDGEVLKAYFSNDYNGVDVTAATWTELTFSIPSKPSSGYSDFTSSGNISLSSYSGTNCYIGFKYTSTDEAAATWELDNITLASTTNDPVIEIESDNFELTASDQDGYLDITYANISISQSDDFAIQFCDDQGTALASGSEPDWIQLDVTTQLGEEGYFVYYVVDANNDIARTAYFKVFALGDTDYVYSNLVTVTQAAPVIDYATLPFTWNDATAPTGVTIDNVGSYSSSPRLKLINSSNGDGYVILKINAAPGAIVFDVKGNGSSTGAPATGTFSVMTSTNGEDYTTLASYTSIGSTKQTMCFTNISADTRYIKWTYTKSTGDGNVALGNIIVTKAMDAVASSTTWTAGDFTPAENHSYVVGSGSTLTLSGDFSSVIDEPYYIIVEDGGQLIHTAAVSATVKKNINAYTEGQKDGWYTIASPVAAANIGIAATGTYDLYKYDEENVLWLNQELPANSALFENFNQGVGYLYGNAAQTELQFAGEMVGTNTEITVPLSCSASNANLQGFNLVGNPFTCNLVAGDVNILDAALTSYYYVAGGSELTPALISGRPIKPGEGFFVKTSTAGNLVINPSSKGGRGMDKPAYVRIEAGNESYMDQAYIQIGQGNTLNKMTINDNVAHVSVLNDHAEYAVATIEAAQGQMPVNFKAAADGTYTISVEAENLDVNYLHLIDNITGMDVDLLATPSYTFEARKSDIASRFRLVFDANTGNDETKDNFAFINNGELIVNGNGTVQVIDILGRQMFSHEVNSAFRIQNSSFAPGVYVLRLVNGNDVKTQKIVIK